jgi:hypothetical protein
LDTGGFLKSQAAQLSKTSVLAAFRMTRASAAGNPKSKLISVGSFLKMAA